MKTFLEPWYVIDNGILTQSRVVDRVGVDACIIPATMGVVGPEYARRIVACVNALRRLSTDEIERCVVNPPDYWLPVYDSVRSSTLLRIQEACTPTGAPERVIEYDPAQVEVEGAELDGLAGEPIRLTHEEAAKAMRSQWPALEGEL